MSNILKKAIIFFSLIYIGFIIVLNGIVFVDNNLVIYILPVLLILLLIYFSTSFLKIKSVIFCIILFMSCFILKAIVTALVYGDPISDFSLFYSAAKSVSRGDFSFSDIPYFKIWGYQTGIVLYYAGLIKILGDNLLLLLLTNCACIAGVNVFIYLIARNFIEEKYARFIALIYMLYPATYFLAPALTNQHISNLLMVAGIYLLISQFSPGTKKHSILIIAASGLLTATGNIMRPQGILVILALLIFCIVIISTLFTNRTEYLKYIKSTVLFVIIYFLVNTSVSLVISSTNINKNGLKNSYPLWKFVVGLNYETKGTYSGKDASMLFNIKDTAERDRLSRDVILERLSDPVRFIKLMYYKHDQMWASFDTLEWGFGKLVNRDLTVLNHQIPGDSILWILKKSEKMFYIAIFILFWIGLLAVNKQKGIENGYLLILLILMAYMGTYCFIEIQQRYRDFAMIFIFILGGKGLSSIVQLINKRLGQRIP